VNRGPEPSKESPARNEACSDFEVDAWQLSELVGKSARAFYEITGHYGIPSEIHSVDLPDDAEHVEHPSRHRGRMVRGLDRVHLHRAIETALAEDPKRFRRLDSGIGLPGMTLLYPAR
jgi:hypothetical protein